MKKLFRAIASLVFGVLLFVAVGCSVNSASFKGCVANETAHSLSMRYRYFNGTKTSQKKYRAGESIQVEATTSSGSLRLVIEKSDGTEIYSGSLVDFPSFTVNIPEDGKYTIRLVAQKHSGSILLSW